MHKEDGVLFHSTGVYCMEQRLDLPGRIPSEKQNPFTTDVCVAYLKSAELNRGLFI